MVYFSQFGGTLVKICSPPIIISNEILFTENRYHVKKFHAQEVDVPTNHLDYHKPFRVSSSKVILVDL